MDQVQIKSILKTSEKKKQRKIYHLVVFAVMAFSIVCVPVILHQQISAITPHQQYVLHALASEISQMSDGETSSVLRRLAHHYNVASYRDISRWRYDEAQEYLASQLDDHI